VLCTVCSRSTAAMGVACVWHVMHQKEVPWHVMHQKEVPWHVMHQKEVQGPPTGHRDMLCQLRALICHHGVTCQTGRLFAGELASYPAAAGS
jgi:hypothetical protein